MGAHEDGNMDPKGTAPILVTGPARSGKSEWAEQLALVSGCEVVYVATARLDSQDPEWMERIQRHRQRRPASWRLQEVPTALSEVIAQAPAHHCLLIDSLGTWTANWLAASDDDWQAACRHLLTALSQTQSRVILVAEETGWGVVPAYPAGRQFRDRLGHLTRQVANLAGKAYLVVAGYAIDLQVVGHRLPSQVAGE